MREWFKQGSKLMLSVVASVALVYPSTGFSEEETNDEPDAMTMFGDAIFVRPLLAAATVVGAGAFIVTLPFSAMGGNTKEAAHTLVGTPADALLFRCLGCSEQEDLARDQQKAETAKVQAAAEAAAKEAKREKEAAEEIERQKAAAASGQLNPQCKNLWCT